MIEIAERAARWKMFAYVSDETFDSLATRCRTLIESGRRMTVLTRYEGRDEFPSVKTGLVPDNNPDHLRGGVHIVERHNYKGFEVRLSPGLEVHGFGIYTGDGRNEEAQARTFNRPAGTPGDTATTVAVDGGLTNDHGRDDRIEIRHLNQFGVMTQTVIVFDYVETKALADEAATALDQLAAYADEHGPLDAGALCTLASRARNDWKTLTDLLELD
jgi:hypothetical protein